MSIRSQALSAFRWSASVRLVSQIITWAITLVVVRLLTPSDYGLLAMATVFVSFLEMFSNFGLGSAVVQKKDVDNLLLKQVFGLCLIIHISLAALLALTAPMIAAFYGESRVEPVIQILSIEFVLAAFSVIPDAQLQRRMEFRNRSLLDLSSAVLNSVITVTLAFAGAGVWALVTGSVLSKLWKTIGVNWLSPFLHKPDFSLKEVRSLIRFGGHITIASLCWFIFGQTDILICAKLLGKENLGYYSVAMHLASLPVYKISGLVNQIAYPSFSRMQEDRKKLGDNVILGIRILSFFAFPVLWGISSTAPEIVGTILGNKWTPSTITMQIVAIVIPLRMVGNFIQTAIQGIGRSDIVMRNAFWSLAVAPLIFFAGAHLGGILGLSLAWLIISPFASLQGINRAFPAIGLNFSALGKSIAPSVKASIVMYIGVLLVRQIIPHEQIGMLRLFLMVITGAITYCGAAFILNKNGTNEVLELIKSLANIKSK